MCKEENIICSDTRVYVKGQIWLWEDPIYGRKSDGKSVHYGEGTLRYTRFVVIIQALANDKTILVAPISSNSYREIDPTININDGYNKSTSYIRVDNIFPANVKQLVKYICTLKPTAMESIDQSIFECLFGISDDISDTSTETESDISEEYSDDNSDSVLDNDYSEEDTAVDDVTETATPDMGNDDTETSKSTKSTGRKRTKYTMEQMKEIVSLYKYGDIHLIREKYGIRIVAPYVKRWLAKYPELESDGISDTSMDTSETESNISEEYSDVNTDVQDNGYTEDNVLDDVTETATPDIGNDDNVPEELLKTITYYDGLDNGFIEIDAVDISQGIVKFAKMLKSELFAMVPNRISESSIRSIIYDKLHVVVNKHHFIVRQTSHIEKKYKYFIIMLRDIIVDDSIRNKKYIHNIVKEYKYLVSDLIPVDISREIARVLNIQHHVLLNVFSM